MPQHFNIFSNLILIVTSNDCMTKLNRMRPVKVFSGCQKNVPVFNRFFLQPLMPQFRILGHYYG